MIEAFYWWDEAARCKEQASMSVDTELQVELLGLAETCEAVAIRIEDQLTEDIDRHNGISSW
jgi:hypothetical protein